jgi:hypothetical protein
MKRSSLLLVAVLGLSSHFAAHAASDCAAQAAEKKLAGAAKNSFVKKCEKDALAANPATAGCEVKAGEKKLAGAAKNSFVKKCVADAGGAAAAASAGGK